MTVTEDTLIECYFDSKLARWMRDACYDGEADLDYAISDVIDLLNLFNAEYSGEYLEYVYPEMDLMISLAHTIIDYINDEYEDVGVRKRIRQPSDKRLKELFKANWKYIKMPPTKPSEEDRIRAFSKTMGARPGIRGQQNMEKSNIPMHLRGHKTNHKCGIRKLENSVRRMW